MHLLTDGDMAITERNAAVMDGMAKAVRMEVELTRFLRDTSSDRPHHDSLVTDEGRVKEGTFSHLWTLSVSWHYGSAVHKEASAYFDHEIRKKVTALLPKLAREVLSEAQENAKRARVILNQVVKMTESGTAPG